MEKTAFFFTVETGGAVRVSGMVMGEQSEEALFALLQQTKRLDADDPKLTLLLKQVSVFANGRRLTVPAEDGDPETILTVLPMVVMKLNPSLPPLEVSILN